MKIDRELTTKNFWIIVANSTAAFVLSYLIIFYINQFAIVFSSGMFDYAVSFDYNQIYFHIEPYEWTHDAVKLMYSAGPILIFIFGSISMIAYYSLHDEEAKIKIFFLWFAIIAFNYTFGGLMIGNLFKKGVGHVFNWMYFTDTQKMIVALVGFFGLLSTGFLMAKPIAHSANSYFKRLSPETFPFYFTAQIIVPFILGSTIVVSYFIPRILFQERYGWISMAVILLLTFGRINQYETIYFENEEKKIRLSYFILILTLISVIGLRIILNRDYLIRW
jgi:uncharacterized membrane protein